MSVRWFVAFLTATAIVVVVYLYGLSALLAPIMFVLWFFLFLGIFTFRTLMEANSTPGLEKLEEPNFLFSPVYFGWLCVNDRKRWSKCILPFKHNEVAFWVHVGLVAAILLKLDYPPPISWPVGILWMLATAIAVVRSKLLAGTTEWHMLALVI